MIPRVRIVIVTYNASKIIRDCLISVMEDNQRGLVEVVVVDNDSTDGTPSIIRKEFPWVEIIESGDNIGFGAANNMGSVGTKSDYLYFLNSDARVSPRSTEYMVNTLDQSKDSGIAGPMILDREGKKTLSFHRFVTPAYALWIATGLNRLATLNRTNGKLEIRRRPPDKRVKVDRLLGAAFIIRRDLFEEIGGFDPRFFLYSEEEDLCLRAQEHGSDVIYDPGCSVVHLGGESTGSHSALGIASASWSLKYFLRKHFAGYSAEFAILIWTVGLVVRMILFTLIDRSLKSQRVLGLRLAIASMFFDDFYDRKVRPGRK